MAKTEGGARRGGRILLPAAEFKASALAVMRKVHETGQAVTVTSHGRPLVRISAEREVEEPTGCGCMRVTCELLVSEDVAFQPRTTQ